jgi:hypothetical protein
LKNRRGKSNKKKGDRERRKERRKTVKREKPYGIRI